MDGEFCTISSNYDTALLLFKPKNEYFAHT